MATTLNPSEISELIRERIEKFKLAAEARNEGTLTGVSDGIVRIHGLNDVMSGEMVELPGNTYALALNLERDSVGGELLGRVVNALGEPIDGKGPISAKQTSPIEKVAPGVIWRKSVDQPVQTATSRSTR